MDSETLFSDLNYLGSSGTVVSVEQKASLQSSLVSLKRKHKFRKVKLWGIIRGVQKDYFIVHGVGMNELIDKKALYR
jgi:radial spoke head protein 9